jgi:hypothetical protein
MRVLTLKRNSFCRRLQIIKGGKLDHELADNNVRTRAQALVVTPLIGIVFGRHMPIRVDNRRSFGLGFAGCFYCTDVLGRWDADRFITAVGLKHS